ncbi:hypothetical protein [Clostridium kluyveri]|uniref:hypothetical protein n=1 Tax=Clostridium kluyveri TaxID=1534 RepID=UPI000AAEFA94|nr:hypothetical protein [Clostridium kluyveri]UZQ49617.1 hypothetical protein OP486_16945 [Clostridium kluyveri]
MARNNNNLVAQGKVAKFKRNSAEKVQTNSKKIYNGDLVDIDTSPLGGNKKAKAYELEQ